MYDIRTTSISDNILSCTTSIDARDYDIKKQYDKIIYLKKEIRRLEDEKRNLKNVKKVDMPERYIINKNATILFWQNGEKTVVKRAKDDEFNPRLAFLTAFFQHYCGMSKNKANKYLANLEIEQPKKEDK